MVSDDAVSRARPKLNPFLFPSDTDFRFALLIVSVLGASSFIYYWINIPILGTELRAALIECVQKFPYETLGNVQLGSNGGLDLLNAMQAQNLAREACLESIERRQAVNVVVGAIVLLATTAVLYWTTPQRKIRRAGWTPLPSEDAPEVLASLADLCRAADVTPAPTFVWNPLSPSVSGIAFGRWGKRYLGLNGGLVTQFYTDAPAFRAVLMHELAHLKNGDVDKTYLAVATWQAFVLTALIPLALSFVWLLREPGWWDAAIQVLWRVVALGLFVFLLRNATLRARELYTDARVSALDGASSALRRVLNTNTSPQPVTPGALRLALARMFSTHPQPQQRIATLDDAARLFRLDWGTAFAIGLAATVALPAVENVLTLGLPPALEVNATTLAVAALAAFAVAALSVGIWRGSFAAQMRGEPVRAVGRLGLAVGVGMLAGLRLALSITRVLGASATSGDPVTTLIFDVVFAAILIFSLVALAHWSYAGASAWFEVTGSVAQMRLILRLGVALAMSLGVFWLGHYFAVASFRDVWSGDLSTEFLSLFVLVQSASFSPLLIVAYVVVWAFPLSAWLWRRRAKEARPWAYLDAAFNVGFNVGFNEPRPAQAPLRPRLALIVGIACGLAFCAINLGVRLWFLLVVPETTRVTEGFRLLLLNSSIALAALTEVVAAIIVVSIVSRLKVVHGLFAAFVTGCVAVAGFIVINLLLGGSFALDFLMAMFTQLLGYPAPLVLIVAAVTAGFARVLNRERGF